MRFGLLPHFLSLFLGQTAGRGDGDLLLFARGFILGAYVQDAIRIDVESNFNLRHAARRGGNSVQLEFAQRTVVRRELAFALQYVDLHAGLVV